MFILRVGTQPAAPVLTGPASVTASLRPAITWNAVGTSIEYEVWINNRSTNEFRVLVEPASGTSFTPSIDLGIGNFTVWVRALDENGGPPSVWSVPRTFRINTPVTQNPVGHNSTNGLSMVSWQQLKGAAKYDVWIDRLDVPTAQIFRDSNVTGTSVTPHQRDATVASSQRQVSSLGTWTRGRWSRRCMVGFSGFCGRSGACDHQRPESNF